MQRRRRLLDHALEADRFVGGRVLDGTEQTAARRRVRRTLLRRRVARVVVALVVVVQVRMAAGAGDVLAATSSSYKNLK